MAPDHLVDLNFKVEPAFRQNFKMLAAHHGLSGVAVLRMALREWRERHGGPAPVKPRPVVKPASKAAGVHVTVTVSEGGRA